MPDPNSGCIIDQVLSLLSSTAEFCKVDQQLY